MKQKAIRAIPFEAFAQESRVRWRILVREPILDGERLLLVDFLNNTACTAYKREDYSFRIACSKKRREVLMLSENAPLRQAQRQEIRRIRMELVQISEREEKRLWLFFGKKETQNHQIDNLLDWVQAVERENREQRRRERGELMDEAYQLCPEALPEGLIDYIRREILARDSILLYKRGGTRGLCFACGRTVLARGERFHQSGMAICPSCGERVYCALEGGASYSSNYVGNVVAAQKGTDGETVFFRQWQILRDATAEWEQPERFLNETARYAIRGRKIAKWQKECKESLYCSTERYALEGWTRWRGNAIYDGGYYFCPAGIEEALAGTAMQYADLEGYLAEEERSKNTIYFLEYHARYPVVEFLWKRGYRKIVHQKIFGASRENRDAIRWQKTRLKECFHFPLRFLQLKEPQEWTLDDVERLNQLWRIRGEQLSDEEVRLYLAAKGVSARDMARAMVYAAPLKILRYISRQTAQRCETFREQERRGLPPTQIDTLYIYRDYINECETLHLDLSKKEILLPKNLDAAHRRTMEQVKFEQSKADRERFSKAVEKLEKYTWQMGAFSIRPAREQRELTEEGKALHHCVGGYIRRMAEGETAIFFIRRVDKPEEPFFTLELQGKRVIQCRTTHNRSYDAEPDVKEFVDLWIERVVSKGGTRKRKEDAA